MYQKTIVRYELNPKYEVDTQTDDFYDKWLFPCFLGVDDNNNFIWHNNTFPTLTEQRMVHKLFFIEKYPPQLTKQQIENDIHRLIFNLMDLGLIVKNENGKTYKYVFESYKFEKLIIKEILGIDVESFQLLENEQFKILENLLGDIWKKENSLFQKNKNLFIDFESFF